jgi:hypothetical protein
MVGSSIMPLDMRKFETVPTTDPGLKLQLIDRVRQLQPTAYWLMHELIVWNDTRRYPDIPVDNTRSDRQRRNYLNEFQIKHISVPFERSILLHLWALLFDKGPDVQTLRAVAGKILNPKKFTLSKAVRGALEDTLDFFKDESVYEIFQKNRKSFIAHVQSIGPSEDNLINDHLLYRLAPKAIYLAELLHFELEGFRDHRNNQFKAVSEETAPFFHHSAPDDLLARLFSQRSLIATEFDGAAKDFFDALGKRESGTT